MSKKRKLIKLYSALHEAELSPLQKAYREFFKQELNQLGDELDKDCNSPADLTDEECSEFFTRIKNKWPDRKSDVQSNLNESVGSNLNEESLRKYVRKVMNEATTNAGLGGANNSARWVPPGQRNHVNSIQLGGYEQVWEGEPADNPMPDDHRPDGPYTWVQVGKSAKINNKIVRVGADLQIMSEEIRKLVRESFRNQIRKKL